MRFGTQFVAVFIKDPQAIIDYSIDWSDWLAAGDSLMTGSPADGSQWIVPSDLTNEQDSNDSDSTTIWLSGGINGQNYTVTNRVTSTAGRMEDRSIQIMVRNR